jgi:cardiolipin synthase
MLRRGLAIVEYTPAFLHAKVAVVDDDWATVGSSNIDPLSLLLNLEANVIVDEPALVDELARRLEAAFAAGTAVAPPPPRRGWQALAQWWRRGLVAWLANAYLRLAGLGGRY